MDIGILFFILNYFWLSDDPDESASWYCDQHCFKIGAEVTESIWDAASILLPDLVEEANKLGISMTYRKYRHAPRDESGNFKGLWHPLSVWHGLCMSNMKRGLENAQSVFREHTRRTGCIHKASHDCEFLLKNIHRINFSSPVWRRWYNTQNGSSGTDKKSQERRVWCAKHAIDVSKKSMLIVNRDTCAMTPPPIFVFDECLVEGDVIASYRKYYHAKIHTISGGMRYYYTPIPKWLKRDPSIKTVRASQKQKKYKGPVDSEGYAIVIFIN